MVLKVLIAGCSGEERARLEPLVKSVIAQSRAAEGPWHVSLVKVGKKLSVTLNGPGLAKPSFVAAEEELRAAILDALGGAGLPKEVPFSPPVEATRASSTSTEDLHTCGGCERTYVVIYEVRSGEARTTVPVACPHCWQTNQVPVGEWAAAGEEYRAEKA